MEGAPHTAHPVTNSLLSEFVVVLRPPRTDFLDGVEDARRRLGCFVAGQGEDEGHEGGQIALDLSPYDATAGAPMHYVWIVRSV